MYENLGAFNEVHTVNGIKRGIYDSIKYMLFTDHLHGNTYGHAVNFLRVDKTDPNAPVYLGFSTSNVESLNEHFVIFPESDICGRYSF
ncbi:SEC10/PgrA surface exclusion domain-containing protein [Streptococcus equi]|uniref:SEC10/PgrA surface exclusion domain-containing protein n=1 Tax=Streptococcus equi TaxID=1336 RepID=UPI002034E33B|nr:SEC10/PgrA surface exclusion domain-containing protein [Streptococcus equi]